MSAKPDIYQGLFKADVPSAEDGTRPDAVGTSPSLPSPHLHFEVHHKGQVCDPVNFFFASVTPEEYARMLFLSGRTEQSMD